MVGESINFTCIAVDSSHCTIRFLFRIYVCVYVWRVYDTLHHGYLQFRRYPPHDITTLIHQHYIASDLFFSFTSIYIYSYMYRYIKNILSKIKYLCARVCVCICARMRMYFVYVLHTYIHIYACTRARVCARACTYVTYYRVLFFI